MAEKNKISDPLKINLDQIKNELRVREEEMKQEKQNEKKQADEINSLQKENANLNFYLQIMREHSSSPVIITDKKRNVTAMEKRQKDLNLMTESVELKSMELNNITSKLKRSRSTLERIDAELSSSDDEEMTRMQKEKIELRDKIDKNQNLNEDTLKTKKLHEENSK